MRDAFVRTLIDEAQKDRNIILATGDLGFGVLKPYWEAFPKQFFNLGVAEQNLTGFAAGLALEGRIVFTYSIGNFPTLRCVEQIRNDCAYHGANVKIVCVGGGFTYGALGMSHHATEDIAVMRALPDVAVFAPGDSFEAEAAVKAIVRHPGTCYLRLGRGGEPPIHGRPIQDFTIGRALQVKDGKDIAVLFTGGIFDEVKETVEILNARGMKPAIWSFPTVKPIDTETVVRLAGTYALLVTVEEHSIVGGFGSAIAEIMAEMHGQKAVLKRIGIEDTYSSVVGSQKYLRNVYGISGRKIADRIEKIFFRRRLRWASS